MSTEKFSLLCRLFCVITLATTALSSAAYAQTSPRPATPAPQPVPNEPAVTSASFGDWILTCQTMPEGTKPGKLCEVSLSVTIQGQQQPFARLAIGRLSADKPLSATVAAPVNVSFPSVVKVSRGANDAGRDLNWTRCIPSACFAEAALSDEDIKIWRAATDAGRVSFREALGRDVTFPISFRGLAQALDALAKQ